MPDFPELPRIADQPLSLVLLAHNSAAHLSALVEGWTEVLRARGPKADYEILIVDDGSTDATATRAGELAAADPAVRLLRHDTHRGEGAALRTGLAVASRPLVAYVLCDPQYRPADLTKLLAGIDKVHLISGYRAGTPVPALLRWLGALVRGLLNVVFGLDLTPLPGWLGLREHLGRQAARVFLGVRWHDVNCPFRLLRREILGRTPLQTDGPFAHVELLAKANFTGRVLDPEVPLPIVPGREARDRGNFRQNLREAWRVFTQPDFGPTRLSESAGAEPVPVEGMGTAQAP